jgi:hypothetical protein
MCMTIGLEDPWNVRDVYLLVSYLGRVNIQDHDLQHRLFVKSQRR